MRSKLSSSLTPDIPSKSGLLGEPRLESPVTVTPRDPDGTPNPRRDLPTHGAAVHWKLIQMLMLLEAPTGRAVRTDGSQQVDGNLGIQTAAAEVVVHSVAVVNDGGHRRVVAAAAV